VIVIGVDAHKRTHTLVAVDANGRILGERVVDAGDRRAIAMRSSGRTRDSEAMSLGVSKTAAR
jgi:hypothetical protein